jgi:plasmid stabilization system protein ParE
MATVRWSRRAFADIEDLHRFLAKHSPAAARRAIDTLEHAANLLEEFPERGRPAEGPPEGQRELLVGFGSSGYVMLYEIRGEIVRILTVRHMRELGY